MIKNKDIKRKEIFKATQDLIKVTRDFKHAQQSLLLALNDLALLEVTHEKNPLKRSWKELNFKHQLKHYFKVFGDKLLLEEHIDQLKNWEVKD